MAVTTKMVPPSMINSLAVRLQPQVTNRTGELLQPKVSWSKKLELRPVGRSSIHRFHRENHVPPTIKTLP